MSYRIEYIANFYTDVQLVMEFLSEYPAKAGRIFSKMDKILRGLGNMSEIYFEMTQGDMNYLHIFCRNLCHPVVFYGYYVRIFSANLKHFQPSGMSKIVTQQANPKNLKKIASGSLINSHIKVNNSDLVTWNPSQNKKVSIASVTSSSIIMNLSVSIVCSILDSTH